MLRFELLRDALRAFQRKIAAGRDNAHHTNVGIGAGLRDDGRQMHQAFDGLRISGGNQDQIIVRLGRSTPFAQRFKEGRQRVEGEGEYEKHTAAKQQRAPIGKGDDKQTG